MAEMTLAEKVASDFQRDNPDLLAGVKREQGRQRKLANEMAAKGHALSHLRSSFHLWIPRLEASNDPQANRTAREMRDVLKKLEGLLNG